MGVERRELEERVKIHCRIVSIILRTLIRKEKTPQSRRGIVAVPGKSKRSAMFSHL